MPGMIILLIDGREPKEEHYQSPVHASIIVRRWNIAYRLATKKHYITIIPDEPDDTETENSSGNRPGDENQDSDMGHDDKTANISDISVDTYSDRFNIWIG